jgi:hypothetical protein
VPNPKPTPQELTDRPFATGEARDAGVTAWQLSGRRYSSPFRGVHVLGVPDDLFKRCAAAVVAVRPPLAFSHQTAARLMDLPCGREDQQLHVTVLPGRAAVRHRGMVGHVCALAEAEVFELAELPVTVASRTFVDLAAVLRRRSSH